MIQCNGATEVYQVFNQVEYIGHYIQETKAHCQWVLCFSGFKKEKVSFSITDSSVSGKKEIFRDGVSVYSHMVKNTDKETTYKNTLYSLTLDYYTYYLHHVIHIQTLQRKGLLGPFLPRIFRLFVDGVNFEILPHYFKQDHAFSHSIVVSCENPSMCSSSASLSSEAFPISSSSNVVQSSRSRSRELGQYEIRPTELVVHNDISPVISYHSPLS